MATAVSTMNKILRTLQDLPPMPQTMEKILDLSKDEKASAKDLANVIAHDQSLTTKVLKLVNSPFYGFPQKITSIQQATALLGFSVVENLALAGMFVDTLRRSLKSYGLDKGSLWVHSIMTAYGAQALATRHNRALRDTAFTAGLIHDLGKVILDRFLGEQFEAILGMVQSENIEFPSAEKQVLGFDHAEIGAMAAQKWRLSPELVETIQFHHQPTQAKLNRQLCGVVHVANCLCRMTGQGVGYDGMYFKLDEEMLKELGVREGETEDILGEMLERAQEAEKLFA
ncbi:MAG: HDOD domain-containing protein [Nitrospirae bacterium]|nr:HDOD domain-containing protein [Nitrospirota bacterium]